MTTTKRLNIPGDEWEQVRKRVLPHAATDHHYRPGLSCVELAVVDGHRRWTATDSFTCAQLRGGPTKAAAMSVLLSTSLFRPATPKPDVVRLKVTRTEVTVSSEHWDRTAEPIEDDYPDVDGIIAKSLDRPKTIEGRFTAVPRNPSGQFDLVALILDDRAIYARNGSGCYWQIGTCNEPFGMFPIALNRKFLSRCVKTVGDHRAHFDRPLSPVVFISNEHPVTALVMPMCGGAHEWLGAGWREEVVTA